MCARARLRLRSFASSDIIYMLASTCSSPWCSWSGFCAREECTVVSMPMCRRNIGALRNCHSRGRAEGKLGLNKARLRPRNCVDSYQYGDRTIHNNLHKTRDLHISAHNCVDLFLQLSTAAFFLLSPALATDEHNAGSHAMQCWLCMWYPNAHRVGITNAHGTIVAGLTKLWL